MIRANWRWTLDIESEILNELKGVQGKVIHVCSGSSGIGDIRLDRFFDLENQKTESHGRAKKNAGCPNLKGDMRYLPIKSGSAGLVICDPPYDTKHGKDWVQQLISELARITAPGGKMILLSPWVLQHRTLQPVRIWLRPAGPGSFPSYKILSVSVKVNGQITDY